MITNKWLAVVVLMLSGMVLRANSPAPLEPLEKGAFETREYRNLLAEMGYAQSEIDARLEEVFSNLFEGPNKIYFEVGDSMAYISDIKNNDARSEGRSEERRVGKEGRSG